MRRWGRSIAVVVLAGVVTAFVLYGVTSWTPYYAYLGTGVGVRHVSNPGFDPWTGEPHGRIVDFTPIDGSATTTRITQEPEDDMDRPPGSPNSGRLRSHCVHRAHLAHGQVDNRSRSPVGHRTRRPRARSGGWRAGLSACRRELARASTSCRPPRSPRSSGPSRESRPRPPTPPRAPRRAVPIGGAPGQAG